MNEEVIKAISLKKKYTNGNVEVHALNGVDLTVESGEFLSIVGSSGSGKTTLMNIIGGLDYPTHGSILVRENNLIDMTREELAIFRRRNIGFIFQNYNLIPVLSGYENIVLPLKLDQADIDNEFVNEIVYALGIEGMIHQMPNMLSGGQQQRIAIARALSTKPAIILADEPTGNLDSKAGEEILSLLKLSNKKFEQTVIIITHDLDIAKEADRVITIEDGKIVKDEKNEK